MKRLRIMRRQRRGEAGSYAVAFAMLLIPLIGFIGMALDLSLAYTRSTELQSVADGAAIAAARELNGTMAGLTTAKARAQAAAQANKYQFASSIVWSSTALEVSGTPDGPWVPVDSVSSADVPAMRYAKVDTGELGGSPGVVKTLFMRVLADVPADFSVGARAVAGRSATQITPLAICALNNSPTAPRSNSLGAGNEELLEFGFRRGFSYNLLKLNPYGSTVKNYLVNPVDFPAGADNSEHHSLNTVEPFVCNGTVAAPRLNRGSTIYVSEPFPSELTRELNSRFDDYSGGSTCVTTMAPPDLNVKQFVGGYTGWWMNTTPAMATISGSAQTFVTGDDKMLTIGEADPGVEPITVNSYGPLWSFSKPIRYTGGVAFLKNTWSALYPASGGAILTSAYSDTLTSPYNRGASPHVQLPTNPGIRTRRILNIPLISCPLASSTATVLAIGRFLMTAPASATVPAIHAEFGGLVEDDALVVSVALYK